MRQKTAINALFSFLCLITGALSLAAVLLLSEAAMAQQRPVFPGNNNATGPLDSPLNTRVLAHVSTVRTYMMPIAYGIAGIAVLGIGALAMFGRFKWGWLFAVIGAVGLVAAESHLRADIPNNLNTNAIVMGDFSRYVLSNGTQNTMVRDTNTLAQTSGIRARQIGYGIAGLGAMGLATLAFFGRFRWGWLFALCGGLMVLVGYGFAANYISTTAAFPGTIAAEQATMQLADGRGDAELFTHSRTLAYGTANRAIQVAYGLAGLGVLGLGTLAILGRFQWRWFFAVVGGLVIIAGLNGGVRYITG
jgi:hypothetical protein